MTLEELLALQAEEQQSFDPLFGFDPTQITATGPALPIPNQPKPFLESVASGADKLGIMYDDLGDAFMKKGVLGKGGVSDYLGAEVFSPVLDRIGDFSTDLTRGLVSGVAGLGGQILGGSDFSRGVERKALQGLDSFSDAVTDTVNYLTDVELDDAAPIWEKAEALAGNAYDVLTGDVVPWVEDKSKEAIDKGSELLQDTQKKGSDLVSTGVGSGTAPTPPSPNGAPVVPPAPVGPTPEERGATATEAVKKTLMNGDSKQDNAIKQTFDNIVASLGKAGVAVGDTVTAAAKNWNGLSPSTKAALFGSAVTLYAKSQGWKNTAADAATMTANTWTGLQQQEMQSAEAIKRAQIKAASDGTPVGVDGQKYLAEQILNTLNQNESFTKEGDLNPFNNLSDEKRVEFSQKLMQRLIQRYPTKEALNAANISRDVILKEAAAMLKGN